MLLALVLAYQFAGSGRGAAGRRGRGARPVPSREAARAGIGPSRRPSLRLALLKPPGPEPSASGRNLFREKPKAPPPPPPRVTPPPPPPPDPNAPPPPPPPPPPITLRLVGIVQGSGRPVAALTDGRDVFYGREGDIIEGRYRIVKINVESIDIAYAGRARARRCGSGAERRRSEREWSPMADWRPGLKAFLWKAAALVLAWWPVGRVRAPAAPSARPNRPRARATGTRPCTYYEQAVEANPNEATYKIALDRAKIAASRAHLEKAVALEEKDELEAAIAEYKRAAEYDPTNRRASSKAAELEKVLRDRVEAARPRPRDRGR